MDTTHYGKTPTELVASMLTALSPLQVSDGSGCCQTIKRVFSEKADDLKLALTAGVPAVLLYYAGGRTLGQVAHGQLETDRLNFTILCVAGHMSTQLKRQSGDDERDYTAVTSPADVGVEQLQDWSRYFCLRALRTAGAKQVRTDRFTQSFRLSAEQYIAAVYVSCEREVDIYDDATAVYLVNLGICHDPTNGETGPWFEGDNTTPISDWPPPGVDGGVAELND
jgi:hypothetical protein